MAPIEPVMKCSKCGHSNPAGSYLCASCSAPISEETVMMTELTPSDETVMMTGLASQDRSSPVPSGPAAAGEELEPGTVLGDRYEILEMLGIGGMGAVYKAKDRELDRLVALKVIRPDLANNPSIIERFKQELILARQVTHKNVIRVFDLGVAGGIKFITMEFIEGRTLAAVMSERKFTPEESTRVIQQMCRALEAAHAEGVVHRDLKPQNVMVDAQGKASVMDFGLALSSGVQGAPKAGGLGGTPAYMSPEQVTSAEVDHRSDIFTLGVIYYELLLGQLPFQADSVLRSLRMRTEQPAKPVAEVDPKIPKAISDIVAKCMAIDPAARYQSVYELLHELDIVTGDYKPVTPFWKWTAAGAGVLLVLVVVGGLVFGNRIFKPPPPKSMVTVLVADFSNQTGDPVFSGTLESTLKLALEGASFISAYDRTKMRELGLPALTGALNESAAQRIAVSQGLNVVVSGSLERRGAGYRLSVRAVQPVTGKTLAISNETASSKDRVLSAVTKLATTVRKALGDATSESAQRLGMETLTAASLDAVHEYATGLDMLSAGKFAEAQQHLSRAIQLDPNFGMAYTIMASAARNQGRFQDAEQYIKDGIKHIDRMTERERFRTRAYLFLLTSDHQRCVDEYGALLQKYPSDTGAYTNIAVCLVHLRNATKSLEYARRAVAILPKRAIYRANLAMNLAYTGDFQSASAEAAEALKLGYSNGYLMQAFASLGAERPKEADAAYRNLAKTTPSDAQTGLADLAIYEGRYAEAAAMLEKGAAADLSGSKPDRDAAATKFWMLAYVESLRGQSAAALSAAKRALEMNQAFQTRFVAAQVYAALGGTARAAELAAGLANEIQTEPQAYAKLIEGEIALAKGNGQAAVKLFTEANNLLDTWTGRFDLGRAYLAIGRFLEADSELDRCIKRRGEVLSLFLDLPTFGFFPPVYYYQARAREGMKTAGFAESYKKYLAIRGEGDDPLLKEARRRAGP